MTSDEPQQTLTAQSGHQRFNCRDRNDLIALNRTLGLDLPVNPVSNALSRPLTLGRHHLINRIAIQPMEGCDGELDGRPSALTRRRYQRFAAGSAALIWVEATAVVREGRANPHQLMLTEATASDFSDLVKLIRSESKEPVYLVLQLTHSGRYSRPIQDPAPRIAAVNPLLDRPGLTPHVLSDDELTQLIPAYVKSAELAQTVGFDAVDIKACHGYLLNELLGARTRTGRYGGSFENRTRLLLDIVDAVRSAAAIDLAVRLNAYDEVPQPYGWGVRAADHHQPEREELLRLVTELAGRGVRLLNITAGNPYYNPHVNRPFDTGPYRPPTHPLIHLNRMLQAARDVHHQTPDTVVMASGLTWLRHLGGDLAAGLIEAGWADLAGFGRQAFAYPQFSRDLLEEGLQSAKCCIACGKCSEIMRDGGSSGCVIRDAEIYQPIYRKGRAGRPPLTSQAIGEHVVF